MLAYHVLYRTSLVASEKLAKESIPQLGGVAPDGRICLMVLSTRETRLVLPIVVDDSWW